MTSGRSTESGGWLRRVWGDGWGFQTMKNFRCLPYRPLTNEHAVLVGMSGVLDDGDNVGSLLRHVHEVSAGPVGELHCIHQTLLGGGEGRGEWK